MVARAQLHAYTQDHDEPIRAFCARVRGQATICKYSVACPSCNEPVDYTDSVITDVVSQGLADKDIQLDLLGDSNQSPSLEEVLLFVEKKESGKRSATRLADPSHINAIKSTYRKQQNARPRQQDSPSPNPHLDQGDACSYCGQTGHGKKAPTRLRRTSCPAFGHTCGKCQTKNHYPSVCRGGRRSGNTEPNTNATFDHLCTISLDHHIFDHTSEIWRRHSSMPQPTITLHAKVAVDDYPSVGAKTTLTPGSTMIDCIADTGCQSCLTGTQLLSSLGLCETDLLPVTMAMKAADNGEITILGAIIVHLSGTKNPVRSTKQIVYISNSTDRFFLSRQACLGLGIISANFPTVGECLATELTNGDTPCSCPPRCKPPPRPTKLPFPATADNRARLQQWLLDYYASSTFNTCEHTPLPMMDGKPLRLMVNLYKEPIAYHTPIPVPIHWHDEVKAGLDWDISLGVIEPVPVGTPVTYCHSTVICAKKSGKPRRTVDMQALNVHATRETHHTPSPFHLARSVPRDTKQSVCDAWNGYHSAPLHEDDRHLTTFITPWGRYRYHVCPQGYIASGDAYTRRSDDIIAHIPDKVKCIDDTILWSDSIESSFHQMTLFLETCGHNGITLNSDKFTFASDSVEFAGFDITADSVRPSQKYLRAIRDFPRLSPSQTSGHGSDLSIRSPTPSPWPI